MTRVKICGIMEIRQGLTAAQAGVDFMGLVFAPSRRRITLERASEIVTAVRALDHAPAAVGVFVNMPAREVNQMAAACGLDRIQLSGDETWEYCKEMDLPLIKALHVAPDSTERDLSEEIEAGYRAIPAGKLSLLLDTQVKGYYGGTGRGFDPDLARKVAARYPVILAGGLTPGNVASVIRQVRPWGVDVSSGVETEGKKDTNKIKEFIQAVRGCGGPC